MSVRSAFTKVTVCFLSLVMIGASGGLALAAAADYASRDEAPAGVSVAGVEVGGLTRSEVRLAIERATVEPLSQPLTVTADGDRYEIDPADYVTVDIESALARVYEPRTGSTLAARALRLATGDVVDHVVEPEVTVDTAALAEAVAGFASDVDSEPVDAAVGVIDGEFRLTEPVEGRRLAREAAVSSLEAALLAGDPAVDLAVEPVEPAVAAEDLGATIVVRLASRTLELYDGATIDRTYRVAVGKPGHGTPRGSWKIVAKRYLPTWGNPGSAWAVNMPRSIPPGPNNPLGTRAMNLNVSGIRIHGTSDVGSIGTAASHGCVRMVRRDVEELYDLVEVGTPVFIVTR